MKRQSIVKTFGDLELPSPKMRRVYMERVTKDKGAGEYQGVVAEILDRLGHNGHAFMMIDEKPIKAGEIHRRPGLHIDGYWVGNRHGGHRRRPVVENSSGWSNGGGTWNSSTFKEPEALVLLSSMQGAVAYEGEWEGYIGEGGDCSSVNVSGLTKRILEAGKVYAGNVTMLHESIPVLRDGIRSLLRLSIPNLAI